LSANAAAVGSLENPQPDTIENGNNGDHRLNCQATDHAADRRRRAGRSSLRLAARGYGPDLRRKIDTGFSYLINYNTLSPGSTRSRRWRTACRSHGDVQHVINLGAEFLTGKEGEYWLNNFPEYGSARG
jgi:hypothetical protein